MTHTHSNPNATTLIILDPGHGGHDAGIVATPDILEKHINLAVCLRLRDELLKQGFEVLLTREDDRPLTDSERLLFANQAGAGLYLSWHCDHLDDPTVSGVSLWVDPRHGDLQHMLDVEHIGDSIAAASGQLMMGVFQEENPIMSRIAPLAVQIRGAFLSHPTERIQALDPDFQAQQAIGAVHGILHLFRRLRDR